MADLSTVVQLIFSGDASQARQAIDQISGDLGKLDSKVQSIAAPFANLADGLLKAEAAALAFGAAVATLAVRETVKFQDSLYLVQKQLGDTGIGIDQARTKIESLALQYGINANDIAESMAGFLAGGNDFVNSTQLVETAIQFMIAGEIEATKATDTLTASLAGWRVPTQDAAAGAQKVGDILNKLADISQSRLLEPIAEAFTRVSPAAYTAGLTMEETGAIVARLVDVFQSGEIAGTAFSSGLSSLSSVTPAATEKLQEIGVAVRDQSGELRLSGDILKDLAAKWGTLTTAQQAEAAAIIFGKEQADKFKVVLGDWGKIQEYLNKTLDQTTGAVGSLAKEVQGKLALISSSVATANEAWRQFLENLGAKITDGGQLNTLIKSAGAVGVAFKDVVNTGGFDPLIDLLKGQVSSLSNLFETVAKNLPEAFEGLDWSGLIDSLEGLGDTVGDLFRSFFGEIDLTTVEGLRSALQTVIKTFETLTIVVTGILQEFSPFVAMLGETIRKFNELDESSKNNRLEFGQFLGAMKLLADAGTGLGLALIAIGRAGLEMGAVLDVVFGAAKLAANSLQVAFDAVILGLLSPIALVAQGLIELDDLQRKLRGKENDPKSSLRTELEGIITTFEAVGANLKRNAEEGSAGLRQIGEGFGIVESEARKAAAEGLNQAEAGLKRVGSAADNAGQSMDDLAKRIPVTQWDGAIGALRAYEDSVNNLEIGKKVADEIQIANKAAEGLQQIQWGDNQQLQELPGNVRKVSDSFDEAGKKSGIYATALEGVSTKYEEVSKGTVKATGAFKGVSEEVTNALDAQKRFNDVLGGTGNDVQVVTAAFNQYLGALGNGAKLTVDQIIDLTKSANDFKIKMEEIASNEKIKFIEAKINLDIASLEADTKKVEAAFESINTTIESTGDVLGGLYDNFAGASSRWDQAKFESWIDEENERRDRALEKQNELIDAQIAQIEEKTRALSRGDAMIKVSGDGLEPELEAFMWAILKRIQIEASADMQEFLLGIG